MGTAATLLQNKWVRIAGGGLVAVVVLLVAWTRYQEVKRDREDIAAELEKIKLAYTNMAQENKTLQKTIAKLKKQVYTTTVQLPDGTIITTTSEYTDSTTTSDTTTDTSKKPVFAPQQKADRYPFVLYGAVTTAGWGVGPGWEVGRFNLPLLPYTHMSIGGIAGQTFEQEWHVGGIISIQWSRK